MKISILSMLAGLLFMVSGCIGTDEVQDAVSTINIVPPEEVTIVNESSFAKVLGQEAQLQVQVNSDLGGTFIADPEDLSWSSNNTTIATVTADGVVNAIGVGSASISVTYTAGTSGEISDAIEISVAGNEQELALIDINSPEGLLVIAPEEELQLSGTPLNAGGVAIEITSTLEWASSDELIATVTQEGLVTAVAEGEVTITATAESVTGSIDLIVGTMDGNSALIRTGQFEGLSGYSAEGEASLETNADGSLSVRLGSDFRTQNGPGLYLYLSNQSNRISGGVELGRLQSTSGAQEYAVPEEVTLDQFSHIVLYCKPFGVGFGTAALSN